MKKIILVLLILLLPSLILADTTVPWVRNTSSDIYPLYINDMVGVGTTTPPYMVTSFSSTIPQLSLSAGAGLAQWTFRNAGGDLFFSTTTVAGSATTSSSALTVSGSGFGTTTVRGLNISGQATSTSNVGFSITTGCYAIGTTCVGSGSFSNTIANGGTATTTFYSGGVVFSDGTKLTQSASTGNFFWDETNKRLGLGTSTPFAKLSVHSIAGEAAFVVGSTTTNFIVDRVGNVGVGTSSPTTLLTVEKNGIAATQTKTLVLQNTTPSTVGTTVQRAPAIALLGTAYNSVSGGSEVGGFVLDALPATAAGTTAASFTIGRQLPNGTISNLITITSGGSINANSSITVGATAGYIMSARSKIFSSADGLIELFNNAGSDFTRLNFGGTSAAFPSILRSSTGLSVNLADGTAGGSLAVGTTTPFGIFQVASSTASAGFKPQIVITDTGAGTDKKHWTVANEGGNLYISTSTDLYATTSVAALEIRNSGAVYAPFTGTSGSAQTGYWCYDTNGQFIRDTTVCLVSDLRAKNITGNFTSSLDEISKLKLLTYHFKPKFNGDFENNPNYTREQLGLGAQDLAKIDPKLVQVYTEDGCNNVFCYKEGEPKSPDTYALATLALGGVKELNIKENWQWFVMFAMFCWIVRLEIKTKKNA